MPTILVIEYDEGLRLYLQGELEGEGYTVMAVADGFEAIKVIDGIHVDLITLDMKMPGIDGIEVLRKAGETGGTLPVVLYTDYPGYKRNMAKYRTFGIEACLQRSCDTSGLKKEIRGILSRPAKQASPNRAESRSLAAGLR
jgi:CheY-like chemotaxis protein